MSKKVSGSAKMMKKFQISRVESIFGTDDNLDQPTAKDDICALDTKIDHNLLDVFQELATNKL